MADLSITPANVLAGSGAKTKTVTAGATITQGMSLYKDTDGSYKLARANASGTAACDGIALTAGATGQPVVIAIPSSGGNINLGASMQVGQVYVVSAATAGKIAPYGDLGDGHEVVIIGIATEEFNLKFHYLDSNILLVA